MPLNKKMHPLLKHLAEEASHQSPDGYPVTIPYSNDFVVKFTELVIKVCVKNIESWRDASDEMMDKDPHWQGYVSGCNDAIVELQTMYNIDHTT